jgi:tRNA 2-thiocytidine biosynthesis protein TtcA
MLAEGDRVAVGVSGGKDSYALLDLLQGLVRRAPISFHVFALVVDQGFMSFEVETIEAHLRSQGIPLHVEVADTPAAEDRFGVDGGAFCSFCASHRRGLLYKAARSLGCNKLALGHHMDDVIETLLMNMFFNGKMMGMPARLQGTREGKGMDLIRPLVYVPEVMLQEYAQVKGFPLVSCGCPTCGTGLQRRQWVKHLLGRLEQESPGLKRSLLQSMKNVQAQQLLLDETGRLALVERLMQGQKVSLEKKEAMASETSPLKV